MPSVTPVVCSDLNGIQLEASAIMSEELIDIIGYTTNLCTDLGTPNDTPEGYNEYNDFLKEIKESNIQTFEPESFDEALNFSELDLVGDNVVIQQIPLSYYVTQNNMLLFGNPLQSKSYQGVSPFDFEDTKELYISPPFEGVSPFDFDHFSTFQTIKEDSVVLSS